MSWRLIACEHHSIKEWCEGIILCLISKRFLCCKKLSRICIWLTCQEIVSFTATSIDFVSSTSKIGTPYDWTFLPQETILQNWTSTLRSSWLRNRAWSSHPVSQRIPTSPSGTSSPTDPTPIRWPPWSPSWIVARNRSWWCTSTSPPSTAPKNFWRKSLFVHQAALNFSLQFWLWSGRNVGAWTC